MQGLDPDSQLNRWAAFAIIHPNCGELYDQAIHYCSRPDSHPFAHWSTDHLADSSRKFHWKTRCILQSPWTASANEQYHTSWPAEHAYHFHFLLSSIIQQNHDHLKHDDGDDVGNGNSSDERLASWGKTLDSSSPKAERSLLWVKMVSDGFVQEAR